MTSVMKSSLSVAAWIILLVGLTQKATPYEYVPSTDDYGEGSATPEDHTATHWEDATASAAGNRSTGECSCGVHTYAWAKDSDYAYAEAHADGSYHKQWDWNGPPGTAPGGTLS